MQLRVKKDIFFFTLFFLIFTFSENYGQVCGGTFGNPIFNESFGSVTTSTQTISPALVPPAFTTYNYKPTFPPIDGDYTISNSTEYTSWGWQKSLDHTTDAPGTYGNMLVVNASYTPGEFYRRRVSNLCSNQIYRFSAWILNIHRSGANFIKPNVTFQIKSVSGVILGSISTGDLPEESSEVWKNFYLDFKSDPSSSQVDVVLINNSPGGIGNDLAIDDITFRPCGPSTQISTNISSVFTSGICDNSQNLQLTADITSGAFQNVNFIWQKSIDDGITWVDITLPTSNPVLNIIAGTYQNNDQYRFIVGESANILSPNCQVISTPQIVKINGYPNAPLVSGFNFCKNSTSNSLSATGSNLIWYNSAVGGIGNTVAPIPNTSVVGVQKFWVSQTVNSCESSRAEITVNVLPNPSQPIVNDENICQDYPSNALSATGNNLLWYTSLSGGIGSATAPIPSTNIAGNFSFWVSQTVNGCESERAKINVIVLPKPFSTKLKDTYICDGGSTTLDVGTEFPSSVWNTVPPVDSQTLPVSNVGTYQVTLTGQNGCKAIQTVKVLAGITPIITNILTGESFIEITAVGGNPPYSFSIDNGVTWQQSNIFNNIKAGVYTVLVKSTLNECLTSKEVAVIFIPNVITANVDGINDFFKIKNIEFFPNAKLIIYDRFGKMIFSSKNYLDFWDGSYNGRKISSDTFWYNLDLGNGYKKSGWILVKNRN